MGENDNLLHWLASGERGLSSDTMVTHLTGINAMGRWGYMSHPCDADDFRRCRLLLEQVPELRARLQAMKTCSPAWETLVAHWDDLCTMMDAENPEWRTGRGWAAQTSARIWHLTYTERQSSQPEEPRHASA